MRIPGNQRNIPYRAVRAAHILHMGGMSVGEISDRIYKRYGYSSPSVCSHSLRRAFRHYRLPIRSSTEMVRLRQRGRLCDGCGGPITERTKSCRTCSQRHSAYKRRGRNSYVPARCWGCGCARDETTDGCRLCRKRHYERDRRRRNAAAGSLGGPDEKPRVTRTGRGAAASTLEEAA